MVFFLFILYNPVYLYRNEHWSVFGSFNPIHTGHLIIANYFAENTDLQQVWFVVSPQNPFKEKASLLDEKHRLYMVNLAIEDNYQLQASNIEFHLPQPSYTIDTLIYLKEKISRT
jgi:nicotinate-nucleotide adenylyltransferase